MSNCVIPNAQPLDDSGTKSFDHNFRFACQPKKNLAPGCLLQVEPHAALVAIEGE